MAVTAEKLVQTQLSNSNAIVSNIASTINTCCISLSATKAIAIGDDGGSGLFARFETIAANGSITQGSRYPVYSGAITSVAGIAFSSTKFVIVYTAGNVIYTIVGDESSGVLTFGLPQVLITATGGTGTCNCAKISSSSVIFATFGGAAYRVIAATVSGTVLTFGTAIPYTMEVTTTSEEAVLSCNIGVLDANTAILNYTTTLPVTPTNIALIIYISGTTLTLQHPMADTAIRARGCKLVKLDDTHIFAAFQNASTLTYVYGAVGVVTNGTIVWGARTTLCTATTPQDSSSFGGFDICMIDSTHIFLTYTNSATVIRNVVCTISAGTTITPEDAGKSDVTVSSLAIKAIYCVALTNALFITSYLDTATLIKTFATTVSGTTLTSGAVVTTAPVVTSNHYGVVERVSDTSFIMAYGLSVDSSLVVGTVATRTITVGSPVKFVSDNGSQYAKSVVMIDATNGLFFYKGLEVDYVTRCCPFSIATAVITQGTPQSLSVLISGASTFYFKAILIDATHVALVVFGDANLEHHLRLYSIDGSYVITEIDKVPLCATDFHSSQNYSLRSTMLLTSTQLATFSGITTKAKIFKISTTKLYTNCVGVYLTSPTALVSTDIATLDASTAIIFGKEDRSTLYYPAVCGVKIIDYLPCCGTKFYINAISQSTTRSAIVSALTATTALVVYGTTITNPYKLTACVLTIDSDAELTAGTPTEILNSVATNPDKLSLDTVSTSRVIAMVNSNAGALMLVLDVNSGLITVGAPTTLITGATGGHTEISSLYFTNESGYDSTIKLYAHGTGTSSANLIYNGTITTGTTTSLLKPNSPIVLPDGDTLRATNALVSGTVTVTAYGLEEV